MQVSVRYIGHSGFMVELNDRCLVFDYYIGREPLDALSKSAHPMVFVSHSHSDHFNPRILAWQAKAPAIQYIFSNDVPAQAPGVVLGPGQEWEQPGIRVKTLPSTDAGVAFWVQADGVSLFHAGDLNDWHWKDVSTAAEATAAQEAFARALTGLEGLPVDIAFVPVDPRLGSEYDRGARSFCRTIKPRHFFPMHFGENTRVPADFCEWARDACPAVAAHDLLRRGQSYTLEMKGENNP